VTPKQRTEPTHRRDEIAEALRGRIGIGEFAPGAEVPSGRELAAQYDCAPMTANAALHILAEDGVITIRPGRGSIVARAVPSIAGPAERMNRSRSGTLFREGDVQEILRCHLTRGHPDARAALRVFDDEELGARDYLVRNAAGAVVTRATSYVHPDVWTAVAEIRGPAPIRDGIIGAIRRVLGREAVDTPTRRKAAHATDEEAAVFGVPEGSPVLVEVTECQLRDGTVVEWNVSVHPEGYWVGR
jgi:GntR family transcriptional regulator